MRENAQAKARRYLHEGRLLITEVNQRRIRATCRGDGQVYALGWAPDQWWCNCPVRTDQCAHLLALRSVVAVRGT